MSKQSRKITYGDEFQSAKDRGIEQAYQLAKAAYGPSVGNVAIELNYGYPDVSRDGVTNMQKLYLEDPNENMAARIVVQASEKSNRLVGDGTTAVVILTYHLYHAAMKLIGSGHNRMEVKRLLDDTAKDIIKAIDNLKIMATPELSRAVAKVSASDEAIGDMIADVMDHIGVEGNVIVEEFDGVGSYDEEVEGFWWPRGFTEQFLINNMAALESRMSDIDIFITEKPLRLAADVAPILNKIIERIGRGSELLIIGDVAEEALATLALNKVNQNIFITLVDVPMSPMRSLFLDDIASVTGATVFSLGSKPASFDITMLGGATKVVVNSYSTTIIGGEGDKERLQTKLELLRKQLKSSESLFDREEISKRLSALTGKISIVRVGAPTEISRGEIRKRVEDAIAATQSAMRDGVVPGGGVALVRVAPSVFKEAFQAPFEALVDNAGYNYKEALFKVLSQSNNWVGYDLRHYGKKPINLLKVGIVDPAEVVKESVRNAISVVGTLITTTTGISYVDRSVKSD